MSEGGGETETERQIETGTGRNRQRGKCSERVHCSEADEHTYWIVLDSTVSNSLLLLLFIEQAVDGCRFSILVNDCSRLLF